MTPIISPKVWAELCLQALSETLEATAFMDVHPAPNGTAVNQKEPYLCSSIEVRAPFHGRVDLLMPAPLLEAIADEVFLERATPGGEEHPSRLHVDIIGEILNTFAGVLMRELVPADGVFALGFPESTHWNPGEEGFPWDLFEANGMICGARATFSES